MIKCAVIQCCGRILEKSPSTWAHNIFQYLQVKPSKSKKNCGRNGLKTVSSRACAMRLGTRTSDKKSLSPLDLGIPSHLHVGRMWPCISSSLLASCMQNTLTFACGKDVAMHFIEPVSLVYAVLLRKFWQAIHIKIKK